MSLLFNTILLPYTSRLFQRRTSHGSHDTPPWLQRAPKKPPKFLQAHNGAVAEGADAQEVHIMAPKRDRRILRQEGADGVATKGEGEVEATGTALVVVAHLHRTRAKHQQ